MSDVVVPSPPSDYGNGDAWADDGPWEVPPDLRPYYATAEPLKTDLEAYLQNGVEVVVPVQVDRQRVVDRGDDSRPARVVYETETVHDLQHRQGADYFPTWLHHKRLNIAVRHKRAADQQAAREAAWLVCAMCNVKSAVVSIAVVPDVGTITLRRRLRIAACPACRPALEHAAHRALIERDENRMLPSGRPAGDVAAEVVAAHLEVTRP